MYDSQMRLLIFIVAYNAESTLEKVLGLIPPEIYNLNYQILIIDDFSSDGVFQTFLLNRGKVVIENNEICVRLLFQPEDFFDFALSYEKFWRYIRPELVYLLDDVNPGCLG